MASTNELLQLTHVDVSKMSRSELAKVVTQLSSTANKRIARLEATDIGRESPAYKKAIKTGGKFTAQGKSQGQLQGEFARLQDFFKLQTSTQKGWQKLRKRRDEIVGRSFDTIDEEKEFWSSYRRLLEGDGDKKGVRDIVMRYGSENAIRLLRREMDLHGSLEIAEDNVSQLLKNEYEYAQLIEALEDEESFYDY